MERFLRANGCSVAQYKAWVGDQSLKGFAQDNPTWTQRQWEDLVLENLETIQANA